MAALDGVELQRVPNVPHFSDDRGWVTHRVVAKVHGEEAGHISISHVPRPMFDEKLADRAEFCRIIEGRQDPTREEMRRAAVRHKRFEQFHVDSIHIAYVHVEPQHRRQGISRCLYLEAARWAGEQGLLLAASDIQRPKVKALWESFIVDDDVPTTETADGRPALDFRPSRATP